MVALFIIRESLHYSCQKPSENKRLVWMESEVEYLRTDGYVGHGGTESRKQSLINIGFG